MIPTIQIATTHVRPKRLVVILLLRRRIYFAFLFRRFRSQDMYRVLVSSIDVRLRSGYSNLYFVFIRAFTSSHNPKISGNLVVSFCTPRYIVDVGKLRSMDECPISENNTKKRTAYTFKTAIYDGAIKRYCKKEVIMCHGSN